MADLDIAILMKDLKDEIVSLALSTVKDFKNEAKDDALKLLSTLEEDIKTWTLKLATGEMSKDDFEWLVLSKKELIEMIALKQVGLSLIKIDELKAKVLGLVVSKVFSLI